MEVVGVSEVGGCKICASLGARISRLGQGWLELSSGRSSGRQVNKHLSFPEVIRERSKEVTVRMKKNQTKGSIREEETARSEYRD